VARRFGCSAAHVMRAVERTRAALAARAYDLRRADDVRALIDVLDVDRRRRRPPPAAGAQAAGAVAGVGAAAGAAGAGAPVARRPGRPRALSPEHVALLAAEVERCPSLYLRELRDRLVAATGGAVRPALSTVSRVLTVQLGLSRKRASRLAWAVRHCPATGARRRGFIGHWFRGVTPAAVCVPGAEYADQVAHWWRPTATACGRGRCSSWTRRRPRSSVPVPVPTAAPGAGSRAL
jgi:hypothetical protein